MILFILGLAGTGYAFYRMAQLVALFVRLISDDIRAKRRGSANPH